MESLKGWQACSGPGAWGPQAIWQRTWAGLRRSAKEGPPEKGVGQDCGPAQGEGLPPPLLYEILFDAFVVLNLGADPLGKLSAGYADLFHRIPEPEGDGVVFLGLVINGDAEGGARFILAAVAAADGA